MEQTKSKKYILADSCASLLDDYTFYFQDHEQEVLAGRVSAFDEAYRPVLDRQGVSFLNLTIGAEYGAQAMYGATDKYYFWDAHKNLDLLQSEAEQGLGSFLLCRSTEDIETALATGRIAVLATLRGAKALEGKANYNTLCNLRTLYRAGLRGLQLTGNNRNRLADGFAQSCTKGRLTNFGVEIVREADRLGMLLDTAQLSDYGFFDLLEQTEGPLIDSHTAMRELCGHPQNIGRERVKAIGERGGVVAISFRAALLAEDGREATLEDLLRHIDYAVEHAGIDHVALGPDYSGVKTPIDRTNNVGYSNLGPVESDYLTPYQSEKYPGYCDGVWYGIRKNDFVRGAACREEFGNVLEALEKRGYRKGDLRKLAGENIIRTYKQVLGSKHLKK